MGDSFAQEIDDLAQDLSEVNERIVMDNMREKAQNDFFVKATIAALQKIGERLNAIDKRLDSLDTGRHGKL